MSIRTTYEHPDIFPPLITLHIEKPRKIDPIPMMKEFNDKEKKNYHDIVSKWI